MTLSGVGAGTHKTTLVYNILACTKTTILNITENVVLLGSIEVGRVGCKGTSTGGLDLSISGGTETYTYSMEFYKC
ncbi:MAG: hypothetical protein COB98_07335 [Flavobacteriaceae bacterium]|nr:MAG: hypothetical protein COB98_07335 [Flavobacteriaceae bacterium]